MSKEKNGESRKKQAKKTLEMPSIDLLEGELKQTQYKTRYGRVLRSTIFSLLEFRRVLFRSPSRSSLPCF